MLRAFGKFRILALCGCLSAVAVMLLTYGAILEVESCECGRNVSSSSDVGFCNLHQVPVECCFSKKLSRVGAKRCCCDPNATECQCDGCKCCERQDKPIPNAPVVPNHQTVELLFVAVVQTSYSVSWSTLNHSRRCPNHRLAHGPTSHQTCAILSRFRC